MTEVNLEEPLKITKKRLQVIKSENNGEFVIFQFDEEDHTLGNALRHMVLKNPGVKFCGYSIPHPNERKVIMQVQMYHGKGSAIDAITTGFENLVEMCQHIKSTFKTAIDEHNASEETMET
ncbi:DNA-directed RNA polymerases I and III subunit RPAC2 [Halotydeus destructor]|nr:DNA-directed RNA polymerases I and III subunit RPAC2 [Halotydeus destructor]